MKSLRQLTLALFALSLAGFAYAEPKKEEAKKTEECKECTCGDACKNSKDCCCKAKQDKKAEAKKEEKKDKK